MGEIRWKCGVWFMKQGMRAMEVVLEGPLGPHVCSDNRLFISVFAHFPRRTKVTPKVGDFFGSD